MSDHWSLNSTAFAELDVKSMNGSPGLGFYRLLVQVNITTRARPPGEEIVVTNIGGELLVQGKGETESFLGHMIQPGNQAPIRIMQYTNTLPAHLEIELDARRIEAIERIRLGEHLSFRLNVYGMAYDHKERAPQKVSAMLQYRANQGTWTEILEQMGYRKTILLEIPVPGEDISPKLTKAAGHLQIAQKHMLQGHFRDAVGACRDVLESLSVELKDEKGQTPEVIQSWFEGTREMSKDERLRLIRKAFKIFTHPARHADEVSTSMEWGPTDARTAIMMAGALLQLAVEKKESKQ